MDPVNTRPKGMSITIGNNAKIDLGTRTEEALLSFGYGKERGKDDDRFGYTIAGNTEAKENLPEGIAIGTNSFARAGSIEIGAHNRVYEGIGIQHVRLHSCSRQAARRGLDDGRHEFVCKRHVHDDLWQLQCAVEPVSGTPCGRYHS